MYSSRTTKSRRRIKLFKTALLRSIIALLVVTPIAAVVYVQFFQADPVIQPTIYELESSQPLQANFNWPDEGVAAIGAVGYGVLESSSDDTQTLPIASITKLFTALAIMEAKPFSPEAQGETITFGPEDEQLYAETLAENGSSYPINSGDQLTQYQALQALLIASANNVADSLVLWAFGSEEAYLEYVNPMVTEMGLRDTVIRDASGMSPQTVSSVDDLMITSEAVLEDPVLSKIVRQSQAVLDPSVGTIFNTNPLLGEQFVVGLKTGTTDEAGANLVFASEFPLTDEVTETIIGITLGLPERSVNTTVSTDILNTSYENFGFIEVVPESTVVGVYEIPWSETQVEIVSNGGLTVAGWTGTAYTPEVSADTATPGVELNQEVGTMNVRVGERDATVPLTVSAPVPEPSLWWRLMNIF